MKAIGNEETESGLLPGVDDARNDDTDLLFDAVSEAGALALGYFGKSPKRERKADGSDVSEADLAVNDLLYDRLMGARPDYGWLSEESGDTPDRLERKRVWVVDPIDGTRAFLNEKPEWTVSVALVEDGRPVLAAVYNPSADAYYKAVAGHGATLSGDPIRVDDRDGISGSRLAIGSKLLKRDIWPEPWPEVETRWVNSIAYRMALVSSGDFHGVMSLSGKNDWDIAAADLLVQEAGGLVTTCHGDSFIYNLETPRKDSVLAAGPALHALLLAQTSRATP